VAAGCSASDGKILSLTMGFLHFSGKLLEAAQSDFFLMLPSLPCKKITGLQVEPETSGARG